MKFARGSFTVMVGGLLVALVSTLPLRSQFFASIAAIWLIAHLMFRRGLSKKEARPAWSSIALSSSAVVGIFLMLYVAVLLLVRSYQFVSRSVADPYAMHVTWIAYAALALVAWLLFNPKTKSPTNQSPQRNAGNPSSADNSHASETPSSLGPRG